MSVVDEGFICPYCLVGFATSGKLQSHFVEMHSGGSEASLGWDAGEESHGVGATAGYGQLGNEEESVDGLLGHQFVQRRMQKPSSCSVCEEIIWQDGIACQSCPVVIHVDGCRGQLTLPCSCVSEMPEVSRHNGVQRSSGPQQPAKGPLALVRRQIAKGRDRYVSEEFDLDLTYITERIIAMSFPATGMESTYRNSLKDVAKMLKTKHQENYMVFNLSEKSYDISRFNNQVLDFGWPDHLAPSLERLSSVCRSMKSWLDTDPQHVVVVHCKGGKGRTGCVIAAFMKYSEICQSAEAALDRFAMKRFYDSKCVGVTQPSQRKYVHYFSDLLAGKISLKTPPVVLNHVIIHGVPNFDGKGGCRVFLKVYVNMKLEHTSGLYVSSEGEERIKISLHGGGLNLQGEVLLKCFHKKSHSGIDSVFRCQFHTAIVRDSLRLVLKKEDLDDAFKDKKFPEGAKVELLFDNDQDKDHGSKEDVDVRSSLLETNGAVAPAELAKHGSLSKRDSYANFEGGFDSGAPEKLPDLIKFSPTSPHQERLVSPPISKGQRSRTESTDSFQMDPQAIERVAMPGSDEVYTVVNKSAPGVRGKFIEAPPDQLCPTKHNGQKANAVAATDPPYVNQPSIPSRNTSKERPITYRRSVNRSPRYPPKPPILPQQQTPGPKVSLYPPPPMTDVDYDEVPDEGEREATHKPVQVKAVQIVMDTSHSGRNGGNIKVDKGHLSSEGVGSKQKAAYDEILVDQLMRLQPVTPRHSGHDGDAGWCRFKFQTLPSNRGDSGRRSSSSSNPTLNSNSGEMYSNLGDLFVGGAFVGESQRRHSFTEGDELIVIRGTGTRTYCAMFAEFPSEGRQYCIRWIVLEKKLKEEDSIIPVGGGAGAVDYNNVSPNRLSLLREERERLATFAGQEEALYTNPEKIVATLNLEVQKKNRALSTAYYNLAMPGAAARGIAVPLPKAGGVVPPKSSLLGEEVSSEDYMNEEPEGMFHTYSNQKELLEQLQAGNSPVPEPALQTAEAGLVPAGEKKIAVMLKNIMSKTPFLKKTPSEIHSQTITETDRQKTLQPFALAGNAQAGRDYEAFFKASAWGAGGEKKSTNKSSDTASSVAPEVLKKLDLSVIKTMDQAEGGETTDERVQPQRPQRVLLSPEIALTPTPACIPSPVPTGSTPGVPPRRGLPSHTPLEPKMSIPTPQGTAVRLGASSTKNAPSSSSSKGHCMVGPTRSVDQLPTYHSRDHRPTSQAPRPIKTEALDASEQGGRSSNVTRGRLPPPRPPPYVPPAAEKSQQKVPSESKVRSLMPYWYQPTITREDAIGLVRQMDSGAFIVRDSQTVSGGYALTIKVNEAIVRQRKKLADTAKVTEDMCVTHFLIQPDPEGVKLQGWNERAFKSLAEFIAHHTVEKLCLPCKLVLPKQGSSGGMVGEGGKGRGRVGGMRAGESREASGVHQVRRRPVTMQEALMTGAACDLVYLGSVDVAGPGSEVTLAETVQQRKSLDMSVSVVTFKAAKEGITISDNVSGLYIKRQYPISSLTYCGADPNDTRWDFPQLQHLGESIPITNAPCFGVITRLPDSGGHSCLLFAQYSPSQPVTSVLSYLHQVMRQRQRQN